jgi:hypothetical protein
MDLLLSDEKIYTNCAAVASKYVTENAGATKIIIKEIHQKDINKKGS